MEHSLFEIAILLAGGGLFLLGLSCFIYVTYRFFSLALSMDMAMLREFKFQAGLPSVSSRVKPSDGSFEPYIEEEAFIQEKVEQLRRKGLTEEELESFVRQAVGTDIGKPEKKGE